MVDRFEYYGTITKDTPKVDTYDMFEYIEVFDILDQDKEESKIIRFGRTDKGKWFFIEPSKWTRHYNVAVRGPVNPHGADEFEELYQQYLKTKKRTKKIKRILK